jgi:hypothetical protein
MISYLRSTDEKKTLKRRYARLPESFSGEKNGVKWRPAHNPGAIKVLMVLERLISGGPYLTKI